MCTNPKTWFCTACRHCPTSRVVMGMQFLSATFPKTNPQEKHTIAATTMQTCPSHQWTLPQSLSIHRFIQVNFLHTVKLSVSPHNSLQVPVSPDAVVRRDCPLQLRLLVLEGLCFTPQVPWTNPFGARVSPIRPGPIARSLAMFQSRSCAAHSPIVPTLDNVPHVASVTFLGRVHVVAHVGLPHHSDHDANRIVAWNNRMQHAYS